MPGSTRGDRQRCLENWKKAWADTDVRCKIYFPIALHREGEAWLYLMYRGGSEKDQDGTCTVTKEVHGSAIDSITSYLWIYQEGRVLHCEGDDGASLSIWFQGVEQTRGTCLSRTRHRSSDS